MPPDPVRCTGFSGAESAYCTLPPYDWCETDEFPTVSTKMETVCVVCDESWGDNGGCGAHGDFWLGSRAFGHAVSTHTTSRASVDCARFGCDDNDYFQVVDIADHRAGFRAELLKFYDSSGCCHVFVILFGFSVLCASHGSVVCTYHVRRSEATFGEIPGCLRAIKFQHTVDDTQAFQDGRLAYGATATTSSHVHDSYRSPRRISDSGNTPALQELLHFSLPRSVLPVQRLCFWSELFTACFHEIATPNLCLPSDVWCHVSDFWTIFWSGTSVWHSVHKTPRMS
jgi:hypothetical protein